MSSNSVLSFRHSLAFRLTVWYAAVFTFSAVLAFTLLYWLMASTVQARTDEELTDDIEEFALLMESGGLDQVLSEIEKEIREEDPSNIFIRMWKMDGSSLYSSDLAMWQGLDDPGKLLQRLGDGEDPILETLALSRHEHKIRTVYGNITPEIVFQIGESLEQDKELMDSLLKGFLLALFTVILLSVPIGLFMSRRALSGVQEVIRTTIDIAGGDLDRRVPVRSRNDEIDILSQTFNMMLDRIQALIIGMREMTDNLAHDLRSPIGRILASTETVLTHTGSKPQIEEMVVETTEECNRLLEIINTTLDIAEAESGAAKLKIAAVDLTELIRDAEELFQPIADGKQIKVSLDLPVQCVVPCDRQRMQRVVANLLDNALKYTPAGREVMIKLIDRGMGVELSVKDTGIGISPEETERIFERFYRCDQSRSEHGNGLGLSLALAFVRAQGGRISVDSATEKGSKFTLLLPRPG